MRTAIFYGLVLNVIFVGLSARGDAYSCNQNDYEAYKQCEILARNAWEGLL